LSFGQLRNNLVEIDAHGQPIPELAESWEALAGATVWRFSLCKGVEFHNGKTLDAEDVIASFHYHRGKDSTSSNEKPAGERHRHPSGWQTGRRF